MQSSSGAPSGQQIQTAKDGTQSIILHTPVVDDHGNVVGTEPRTFTFLLGAGGRQLIWEEEDSSKTQAPSAKEIEDVKTFIRSSALLELALMVAKKTRAELIRFRRTFRQEILKSSPSSSAVHVIDFVRQKYAVQQVGGKGGVGVGGSVQLGNVVSCLLCPVEELLADEVHMSLMGLSDNSAALADALCAAPRTSPLCSVTAVAAVYGLKYGDGRTEKKSADGRGDPEKLRRDVDHGTRGGLREFLLKQLGAAADNKNQEQKASAQDEKVMQVAKRALEATSPEEYWTSRLRDALHPTINKKLLLRVLACNEPSQRQAIGKSYEKLYGPIAPLFTGTDLEAQFWKQAWQ